MIRVFSIICLCLWVAATARPLVAQTDLVPLVETEVDETDVVPGQPVLFRVTILVPTWLAQPIEFPSFEAPDLLVKLFDKSTIAMSRTIDGETWSGVTRTYRLSPMVDGSIPVPSQDVRVLWAEPGKTDPNETTLTIDGFVINGIRPEGSEDLDPFIAANDLQLTQDLSTEARVLKPGDSITRSLTVEITGASPFALPQLFAPEPITGIARYPSEPVVSEKVQDGWLAGTRVESESIVAESGGEGAIAPVELRWFNLKTGQVETARVDGFDVSVDAPVARDRPELDLALLLRLAGLLAALLGGGYLVGRFAVPRLKAYMHHRAGVRLASEGYAYGLVKTAIRNQDYTETLDALKLWRARLRQVPDAQDAALQRAITNLGACYYAEHKTSASQAWAALDRAVGDMRRVGLRPDGADRSILLRPINPTSA